MGRMHWTFLLVATIGPHLQAQAAWVPRFAASNPWPNGLAGATATFETTRQRVVLIGGHTLGVLPAIDNVREWNGWDWQPIVTATPLPVRAYHAAASQWPQPGILVHGGTPYSALLDDTWVFDGVNWSRVAASGVRPSPRLLHAMCYDVVRAVTVLFGGALDRYLVLASNETWEWNGSQWSARSGVGGPGARYGHAMAFDLARTRVVLFGGRTNAGSLGDTWEYDGVQWMQRSPAVSPAARAYATMTYDLSRGRVLLLGGRDATTFDETWEWDGAGNTWRLLLVSGGSCGARDLLAAAYDTPRSRVVVAGGFRLPSSYLADTWELLISSPPASATAIGGGCAGSNGVPALVGVGVPRLGNSGFVLRLTAACPQAPAALVLGPVPVSVPLPGGCTLLVGLPGAVVAATTSAGGAASWPLPVASYPSWLGLDLYAQALVADPQGAAGGASFSNGLQLLLGN